MKHEFALIYKDPRMRPEWVDKETAMEWAEKKDSGRGTIKVAEGMRVDVNEFKTVVSKDRFNDDGRTRSFDSDQLPNNAKKRPVVKKRRAGEFGYDYDEVQRNPDGSIQYEEVVEDNRPISKENLAKLRQKREQLFGQKHTFTYEIEGDDEQYDLNGLLNYAKRMGYTGAKGAYSICSYLTGKGKTVYEHLPAGRKVMIGT